MLRKLRKLWDSFRDWHCSAFHRLGLPTKGYFPCMDCGRLIAVRVKLGGFWDHQAPGQETGIARMAREQQQVNDALSWLEDHYGKQ